MRRRLLIDSASADYGTNFITCTYSSTQGENVQIIGNNFSISGVRQIFADGKEIGVVKQHVFQTAGNHKVKIFFNENITNCQDLFNSCANLKDFDLSNFDMSHVTTMQGMFFKCNGLNAVTFDNLNWSNVTSLRSFMSECKNISTVTFSNMKTGMINDMAWCFNNSNITSCDLRSLDLTTVTTMESIFNNDWNLNTVRIDTACTNLTNTDRMFYLVWTRGTLYYNKAVGFGKFKAPFFWTKTGV